MLAATKVKKSGSEKKVNRRQRNIHKKCTARAKWFLFIIIIFFFLLIRPTDFFGCICCCRRFALHDFIFCLSKL